MHANLWSCIIYARFGKTQAWATFRVAKCHDQHMWGLLSYISLCPRLWDHHLWYGESTLPGGGRATLGKNMYSFLGIFWIFFGGNISLISSRVIINIQNGFWYKDPKKNSCRLSNESDFLTIFFFNTLIFVWMENLSRWFFVKSHELNFSITIEMVQSIHIQYMIKYFIKFCNYLNHLKRILHFVIYHENVYFLTNILFNCLILIKKCSFLWQLQYWVFTS